MQGWEENVGLHLLNRLQLLEENTMVILILPQHFTSRAPFGRKHNNERTKDYRRGSQSFVIDVQGFQYLISRFRNMTPIHGTV